MEGHTIRVIPSMFVEGKEREKNVFIDCTLMNHKSSFKSKYVLQVVDYHPIIHSVNSEVSLPEKYPAKGSSIPLERYVEVQGHILGIQVAQTKGKNDH